MTEAAPHRAGRATNPYAALFNRRLLAWKQDTATLPDAARAAGVYPKHNKTYPICLPREYAAYNLLPNIRVEAQQLFSELNIAWHDSVDKGPSNHLRDSQVQCVNALFGMVADPQRIRLAFGDALDIADVLEIEPDRFLTFEYIGPHDYFSEGVRAGRDVGRRRGTNCTSVDAAFRYVTSAGIIELALVEWKFTESYREPAKRSASSDRLRLGRYGPDLAAADGPVDSELMPVELLLDEPFYQLVRQQLLAYRLERDRVQGAKAVRVVHVLSPDNIGYQESLVRPGHSDLGATVDQVWSRLLKAPDRFVKLDPSVFLDPEVTSDEYVSRYSDRPR